MRRDEMELGSAATLIMGTSPKGETYNSCGEGIPLLNGPTEFGPSHPECTIFTTDSKRKCKPGDLIFCVRGSTTGRMNWADRIYSLGRGVCAIRGETELDTKFIKYAIDLRLEALLKLSGGATFPNLTSSNIATFRIPFPENRHAVARVLSAYDDLIENNTRRIKILEEMAQMIYREWFVNFRFPGHENLKIVDSELGPIPEGWQIASLGDVALTTDYVANGSFASLKERVKYLDRPDYAVLVRLTDFKSGWIGPYVYVPEDSYRFLRKSSLLPGDIILSNVGAYAGTVFRVPDLKLPTTLGPNAVLLRPSDSKEYWFYFLTSHTGQHLLRTITTGSAQPKFNKTDCRNLRVPIPPATLRQGFGDVVSSMDQLCESLRQKNINLRSTRDFLLPKLISGEVSIEAAEEAALEAVV